jgi:hypothetical protein
MTRFRERSDRVTNAFERLALRGVFQGFNVSPGARGTLRYSFTWLMRRPMSATYPPAPGVLAFPRLLPAVDRAGTMAADLKALVAERLSRTSPAHKRIDARRAGLDWHVRGRVASLTLTVRGENQEYAVRHGLNLINEIFVLLRQTYPDYLTEHFGLPSE